MYAILQHGGHQYRVAPGDRLLVNRLSADLGQVVALEPVVFLQSGDGAGSTEASGSRVAATVVAHRRGTKLRVFKYKPKKRYRRTRGYRSDLTELLIEAVVGKGEELPKASWTPGKPAAADKPAETPVKRGRSSATATAEAPAATPARAAKTKPATKPVAAEDESTSAAADSAADETTED